jgi:hypothetical protein
MPPRSPDWTPSTSHYAHRGEILQLALDDRWNNRGNENLHPCLVYCGCSPGRLQLVREIRCLSLKKHSRFLGIPAPMLAKVITFALVGIDAVPVEAEMDVSQGLRKTVLVRPV